MWSVIFSAVALISDSMFRLIVASYVTSQISALCRPVSAGNAVTPGRGTPSFIDTVASTASLTMKYVKPVASNCNAPLNIATSVKVVVVLVIVVPVVKDVLLLVGVVVLLSVVVLTVVVLTVVVLRVVLVVLLVNVPLLMLILLTLEVVVLLMVVELMVVVLVTLVLLIVVVLLWVVLVLVAVAVVVVEVVEVVVRLVVVLVVVVEVLVGKTTVGVENEETVTAYALAAAVSLFAAAKDTMFELIVDVKSERVADENDDARSSAEVPSGVLMV
jgi:hypothetical protein